MSFHIDEALIKQTIQAIEKLKALPEGWKSSSLMVGNTSIRYSIEELFKSIIIENLSKWRKLERVQASYDVHTNHWLFQDQYVSQEQLIQALKNDLRKSSREGDLKEWSILYHTVFVKHTLSKAEISNIVGYSDRQVRNFQSRGIEILTRHIQHAEAAQAERLQQEQVLTPQNLIEQHGSNLVNEAKSLLSLGKYDQALIKCDEAIDYTQEHHIALYFVLAHSIKAYTLLHEPGQDVFRVEEVLYDLCAHPLFEDGYSNPARRALAMMEYHTQCAYLHKRKGEIAKALEEAHEAVGWMRKLRYSDPLMGYDALHTLGTMFWAAGQYQNAINTYQELLAILEQQNSHDQAYSIWGSMGLTYWSLSDYKQAEACLQKAIQGAREQKNLWRVAYEQGNIGLVYLSQGKLAKSKEALQQHLQNAQVVGATGEITRARANLGYLCLFNGQYSLARVLLEFAQGEIKKMKKPEQGCVIATSLCLLETLSDHPDKALNYAQEAWNYAKAIDTPQAQIIALRSLGFCEALDRNTRLEYLCQAQELAHQQARHFDEAASCFAIAYLSTNKAEKKAYWLKGTEHLHAIGASAWLEQITLDRYPYLPTMM